MVAADSGSFAVAVVPRNLRKPTPKRCLHWWNEWCWMWHGVGMMMYQKIPDDELPDEE